MRQVNPHTHKEIRLCFITRFMPSRISLFIWLTLAAAQPFTSILRDKRVGGRELTPGERESSAGEQGDAVM